MKKSKALIMLENMDQWQELSNVQLSNLIGWRFWWHKYTLTKYGVIFKKRKGKWYVEYFKIIYIPKTLIYKGRTQIKLIKSVSWFEGVCKRLWV